MSKLATEEASGYQPVRAPRGSATFLQRLAAGSRAAHVDE